LLLNNNWDLNSHNLKAGEILSKPSIFENPSNPLPLQKVQDLENSNENLEQILNETKKLPSEQPLFPPNEDLEDVGLEALFNPPQDNVHLLPPPEPPDIDTPFRRRKSPRGHPTASNSILQNFAYTSDESEYFSDNSDHTSDYSDPNQTNFNNLNIELDMSQSYRATFVSRRSKTPSVTFLVTPLK
jgi:hypothetical protein